MDNYYLKRQLLLDIQEATRINQLNMDLMETLSYTGHWILNYCSKNNLEPPNLEKLRELITKSRNLIILMSVNSTPKNLHPPTTPDDSTQSKRHIN